MTNLALIVNQIKNEISVDAAGKGKASIRAVARLVGVDSKSILGSIRTSEQNNPSRLMRILARYGFNTQEWNKYGVPNEAIPHIVHYYAYEAGRRCTNKAKSAWLYYQGNKSFQGFEYTETSSSSKISPESKVRDRLAGILSYENPRVEVMTPAGRIDIMTDKQIIEVKKSYHWKNSIGQILVYGAYYPHLSKRIHLFGKADQTLSNVIEYHCNQLNITLTWE